MTHNVVQDSVRLQYKKHCFLANVVDNPLASTQLSLREKLVRVKDWHRAWKTLEWKKELTVTLPSKTILEYLMLDGAVLTHTSLEPAHEIAFHRFPSLLRGVPENEWTLSGHTFTPSSFLYDSTQDILILTEIR